MAKPLIAAKVQIISGIATRMGIVQNADGVTADNACFCCLFQHGGLDIARVGIPVVLVGPTG